MKTFEDYNIDDEEIEMEELFLDLAHLDDLEIKFNFVSPGTSNKLLYYYDNKLLFVNEKNIKWFSINRHLICVEFRIEFGFDESDTLLFMETMIDKYFGLREYYIKLFSVI